MKCKTSILPERTICIVDSNAGLRKQITNEFKEIDNSIRIAAFESALAAEKELTEAMSRKHLEPTVIVTDTIGVDDSGESLADYVRHSFPLTRILLHSRRAGLDDAARLAFQERLIDDYVSKVDRAEELVPRVTALHQKYIREWPLAGIRQYISRCPDPESPFFPDGEGNYLNMFEVYWEIVRRTSLGEELARTWQGMVEEWLEPELAAK